MGLKKVTRTFFDRHDEKRNYLKFEINRMNIKSFDALPKDRKIFMIAFYNDCIETLKIFRDELTKKMSALNDAECDATDAKL